MSDCKGIHKMIDKIKEEIAGYAEKPSLTPAEWDMVFRAGQAYKNFWTGCAMEESEEGWDSVRTSDYSGARRRGAIGRYTSGSGMRSPDYSGEYSGHNKMELLDAYYDMLEEADSEEERMMIQRKIRKLKGDR